MKNIQKFCKEYNMLPEGCSVLVGVSGGSDSMCLLHMLWSMSKSSNFSISAAHFNHCLRGKESDDDEAFVVEYCSRLGIPCFVGSGDVKAEALRLGTGTEDAARKMRYDFFEKTAYGIGADKIATAHNADDNVETVLLHLTRGSGLNGLCGIPPVRGNIIRPLLPMSRSEIEEYLKINNIPHREDSSNFSDDYSRNKIRHHVMPVLRQINPSVSSTVFSSVKMLTEDEKALSSLANSFINSELNNGAISASKLLALPKAVACRVIKLFYGDNLESSHVESILELAGNSIPSASLSLPNGTVRRQYDSLVLGSAAEITFSPVELIPGKYCDIPELGLRIHCCLIEKYEDINNSLTTFFFKYDNICGKIIVRSRLAGDSIKLSSKSGTKTLKKLFIEKKIPKYMRSQICIIADDKGPLAVYGIGCDQRVRPALGAHALKVTIEEITKND